MRTKMIQMVCLAALCATVSVACCCGDAKTEPVVWNDGVRFCESTYPYDGGLLVANFGTEELNPLNGEGKGYILYFDAEGQSRVLVPADGSLSAPKGMYVRDGRLFVCDVHRIVVYDLKNVGTAEPQVIEMPAEEDLFVNDLAAWGDALYVSVTNSGRIYRIDLTEPAQPGVPELWLSIAGPNGLVVRDGVMYVASYSPDGVPTGEHVVYRIADLTAPQPEALISTPGQYDGIAFSGDAKALYVTNWAPVGIARLDLESGALSPLALPLAEPLVGPADITVQGGKIYIPDLPNSRVVVIDEQ